MQQNYKLVFDLANESPLRHPAIFLGPVIFSAISAILTLTPGFVRGRRAGGIGGKVVSVFCWLFFSFSITITILMIGGSVVLHDILVKREKDFDLPVVEGCLQFFHPMPASGHDMERFRVNGSSFSYSEYQVTEGFNRTEVHGGPIHADSRIRAVHSGGLIVRLEVVSHSCPPAPDISPAQR